MPENTKEEWDMTNFGDTQFIKIQRPEDQSSIPAMNAETVLKKVYAALKEKGYDPVTQIVGYIMSGDPTYITNHQNARALVMKVERDDLLQELVGHYIETKL